MNDKVLPVLVFFIPVVLYINSCFCGFVFDDVSAIINNQDLRSKSPFSNLLYNDFWGTPMTKESSHKSYRPLTVLTFRINYYISGLEAWSYHLVNVFLHAITCYLVYKLYMLFVKVSFNSKVMQPAKAKVDKTSKTPPQHLPISVVDVEHHNLIAYLATSLFIVHPVHTEAVTGVVGRAELLSAIFFILAILCFSKFTFRYMCLSFLCCIFAVVSKEQGITALAVCAVFDILLVHKYSLDDFCLLLVMSVTSPPGVRFKSLLLRMFCLASFAFILLYLRFVAMGNNLPHFEVFDNPAAASLFPTRHLTFNYLLPVNAWILLNPGNLLCDWTMGTIPLISDMTDLRNMATLTFWIIFIILGLYAFFGRSPYCKLSAVALSLLAFPFLPATNLVFPVGFVVAERILYIPSIGFCLLVAIGIVKLRERLKLGSWIWLPVSILLLSHGLKTAHRNLEWESEETLFKSALKVTTTNAKVWNNIGHAYEGEQKWKEALQYFTQAVKVQPDDLGALMNVARMQERLEQRQLAEETYWKAKALLPKPIAGQSYTARIAPKHLKIFTRLGNLIKRDQSRLAEVDQLYKEVILMRPSFVDAHINRGEILSRMNRPGEAVTSYQSALRYAENKSDIYFNIGVIRAAMDNKTGAIEAYTYAIHHDPDHVKALYNSAVIFQETGDKELIKRAKIRIDRILRLEPLNILAKTLLGSIFMDLGEYNEALRCWYEVLKVDPKNKASLFNKALLLSKMDGQTNSCVEATQQLLGVYPNHVKGLLLYGDTLLNKVKNVEEAQRIYARVIKLDPDNIQARHNYCVTIFQLKRLEDSEKCMEEVSRLAPHETYIAENLSIIRQRLALKRADDEKTREANRGVKITETLDEKVEREAPRVEIEDTIYVAKPIKRRNVDVIEEAQKVVNKMKKSMDREEVIDQKLMQAMRAVEKLKRLGAKSEEKINEKCETKKGNTASLKERALKALDELEAQLYT